MSGKPDLNAVRAPDEQAAEERAWNVVRTAHPELVASRPSGLRRLPVAALVVGAVLAGVVALSPAGATVSRLITRVLGVEHAASALSSVPTGGRLLVSSRAGTWTVGADGSTKRLGPWSGASWSPHGRYLTVVAQGSLAAVDPQGRTQWTLARPEIADPRWYPPLGYRVAYLSGATLRVVAGDGTGDHLLALRVARLAAAWRPAHPFQLAYVTDHGRIVLRGADTGGLLWSVASPTKIDQLVWSSDGQHLLAAGPAGVRIYNPNGRLTASTTLGRTAPLIDAALAPNGRTLALVLGGSSGEVLLEDTAFPAGSPRRVFAGFGLRQAAFSPDGKWLLVTWPAADQWVFVRIQGAPRITAVSRITEQFSTPSVRTFPELGGWCCAPGGGG
jgi:WD40 repeat protein